MLDCVSPEGKPMRRAWCVEGFEDRGGGFRRVTGLRAVHGGYGAPLRSHRVVVVAAVGRDLRPTGTEAGGESAWLDDHDGDAVEGHFGGKG